MKRNKRIIIVMFLSIAVLISSFVMSNGTLTDFSKYTSKVNDSLADSLKTKDPDRIYGKLGENMSSEDVSLKNAGIIVAYVNNEAIGLNEYNYNKTFDQTKAKEFNYAIPDDQSIFNDLIERKIIVNEARTAGLYPNENEIDSYVEEQKSIFYSNDDLYLDARSQLRSLLKAWEITENDYFYIMRNIWADSIAYSNWFEKNILPQINETSGPVQNEKITKAIMEKNDQRIKELSEKAKIVITKDGAAIGLKLSSY